MTVPQQKGDRIRQKIMNGLNRLGTRFGADPREYLYVNNHQLSIRHRQTRADTETILQCLVREQYEIPEIRGELAGVVDRYYAAIRDQKKTPLIIDAGANIGASVLWFATRFPNSHIVALEPAPDNYELLCENVRSFDVETQQIGLGAREGRGTLYDPGYGPWSYRMEPGSGGGEITIQTLEQALSGAASTELIPFILKLDIEGGEAGVFDGPNNPASLFPVVIIEPHDWMLPRAQTSHSFLRFHLENDRGFLSRGENVFSLDFPKLENGISQSDKISHMCCCA